MKRFSYSVWMTVVVLVLTVAPTGCASDVPGNDPLRSRCFRLDYGATLKQLPSGAQVRVWLPVPISSEHQTIKPLDRSLPAQPTFTSDPTYGNQILYFETVAPDAGALTFNTSYLVHRQEVSRFSTRADKKKLTDRQRQLFLSANSLVPLEGKQLELLDGLNLSNDPLVVARALYARVDDHVRYDKSQPGFGRGDVRWVCDSRTGNCTDFHSLFISLARSQGLPARFEIGFPLPPEQGTGKIGGYHCWAFVHLDQQGWLPVDISEADQNPELKEYYFGNLSPDRVTFTTGRDIRLLPPPAASPLNFFIYPHVEVSGTPWPQEKMKLSFTYTDVPPG